MGTCKLFVNGISLFFLFLMPPHVHTNFRGPPPGCGGSVTEFWGWDAHEAQLLTTQTIIDVYLLTL